MKFTLRVFQDKIIFGVVSGLIAHGVMEIFEFFFWKANLLKHTLAHYAGSIIIDLHTLHHTSYGSVVSFLADYIYGAILGVFFIYLVTGTKNLREGRGYFILKGLFYGAFLWFFSYGGLRSLSIVKLREVGPGDALIAFFLHLLFGFLLGWITHKYWRFDS